MNMSIRLSHFCSRCLLACSVLALLGAPTVYAKTTTPAKSTTSAKDHKAKETKEAAKETKETKESKATIQKSDAVTVLKDGTNVRTGPSTDDQVAMELFQGYPLKVVETKGDWLKVADFENDTGWISKSLVGAGNTLIVNAKNSINMRSEPNTSAAIVANIERGVVLTKISTQGEWVKVKHAKGTEGWIHKNLLWP